MPHSTPSSVALSENQSGRRRFDMLVVVGVAGACRLLIYPLLSPPLPFFKYLRLGEDVAKVHWMTVGRPFTSSPLYVCGMALLHGKLGLQAPAIIALQMGMGVLTALLCYRIALRFCSRPVALGTAIGIGITGDLILYEAQILSESWAVFLNIASLFALFKVDALDSDTRSASSSVQSLDGPTFSWIQALFWIALAGLLLGLSVAIRPNGLLLVVAASLLLLRRPFLRHLILIGVLLTTAVIPMIPFTLHNYRVSGEFIPVSASGGVILYASWRPGSPGLRYSPPDADAEIEQLLLRSSFRQGEKTRASSVSERAAARLVDMGVSKEEIDRLTGPDVEPGYPYEHDAYRILASLAAGRPLSWYQADQFYREEAKKVMQRYPFRCAQLAVRKLGYTVHAYSSHDIQPAIVASMIMGPWDDLSTGLILWLGLVFFPFGVQRMKLPAAWIAAYGVSVLLLYTMARFRVPMFPLLALVAGAGFERCLECWRDRSFRVRVAMLLWIAASLGLVLAPYPQIERDKVLRRAFARSYWWLPMRTRNGDLVESSSTSRRRLLKVSPKAVARVDRCLSKRDNENETVPMQLPGPDDLETAMEIAKDPETSAWGYYVAAVHHARKGDMEQAGKRARKSFEEGGKFLVVEESYLRGYSIARHLRLLMGETSTGRI